MRYFSLLGLQHVILYLFPTLIFMIFFWAALAYAHFHTQRSRKRETEIIYTYPDEIQDRNTPFPLFMLLAIVAVVLWGIGYILAIGRLGVRI